MTNHGNPNSRSTLSPLASGQTQDHVHRSLEGDIVIDHLIEAQIQQFIKELSKFPDHYFIKSTIGINMTEDQHRRVSALISFLLNSLDSTNDYHSDLCEINITEHFKDRLKLRSGIFEQISPEDFVTVRRFITSFTNVSNVFRWKPIRGITYVLSSSTPNHEQDRVIISLKRHKSRLQSGATLKITIHAITYYND